MATSSLDLPASTAFLACEEDEVEDFVSRSVLAWLASALSDLQLPLWTRTTDSFHTQVRQSAECFLRFSALPGVLDGALAYVAGLLRRFGVCMQLLVMRRAFEGPTVESNRAGAIIQSRSPTA